MARGIVAARQGPKRKLYTIQCERCFITEEPDLLILMTIHFHSRSRNGENPRLCRDCRVKAYPDCICDYCKDADAALNLMAQAWDEGYKTAMFDKEYYSANANPYRKDAR